MTASQISGVIDSHHRLEDQTGHAVRTANGDPTILQQFKECSEANEQALRDAKNIKELIGITVKTVDKQIFTRQRGHSLQGVPMSETNYNLQFDPINFMQKVPCMGDRDFLVSQSILHNSTTRNRVSEAVHRQKFMQQTGNQGRNGANYHTSQQQRKPSSNNGLRGLLPELPLNGLKVQKPR